jgi:hypothetical protein
MSKSRDIPRLGSTLISRKGEASPTGSPDELVSPTISGDAAADATAPSSRPAGVAGTIAVTVRLDPHRYERLKIYGVRSRRSNQDLLIEALDALLKRVSA